MLGESCRMVATQAHALGGGMLAQKTAARRQLQVASPHLLARAIIDVQIQQAGVWATLFQRDTGELDAAGRPGQAEDRVMAERVAAALQEVYGAGKLAQGAQRPMKQLGAPGR